MFFALGKQILGDTPNSCWIRNKMEQLSRGGSWPFSTASNVFTLIPRRLAISSGVKPCSSRRAQRCFPNRTISWWCSVLFSWFPDIYERGSCVRALAHSWYIKWKKGGEYRTILCGEKCPKKQPPNKKRGVLIGEIDLTHGRGAHAELNSAARPRAFAERPTDRKNCFIVSKSLTPTDFHGLVGFAVQ